MIIEINEDLFPFFNDDIFGNVVSCSCGIQFGVVWPGWGAPVTIYCVDERGGKHGLDAKFCIPDDIIVPNMMTERPIMEKDTDAVALDRVLRAGDLGSICGIDSYLVIEGDGVVLYQVTSVVH